MSPEPFNLVAMGLKGSGKTTYLASLWHQMEAGEIAARLSAPALQPDREYLNGIRDRWLSLQEVGRTSQRGTQTVTLPLMDKSTGKGIELCVPDLSGETYSLQWTTRKAAASYAEYVQDCGGILLFIHAHGVKKSELIGPAALSQGNVETSSEAPNAWTPTMSPTQVQLVDLLQTFAWLRKTTRPFRVAVIISAWDEITSSIFPTEWLERRLPLLAQYIRSNPERFQSRVYGISAIGGDRERDRERLLKLSMASHRPLVVDGTDDKLNLSSPLEYLLGLEAAN